MLPNPLRLHRTGFDQAFLGVDLAEGRQSRANREVT